MMTGQNVLQMFCIAVLRTFYKVLKIIQKSKIVLPNYLKLVTSIHFSKVTYINIQNEKLSGDIENTNLGLKNFINELDNRVTKRLKDDP